MACYNGECCQYDALGNPEIYRCHDLSWTKVRKLARFDANIFEYNASGIRFKKNNTVYTLDGDRILKETDGTKTLTYYYANGNAPVGFNYNGTDYYYRRNIQGDVVGIYSSGGYIVARYVYDAWGNHKIYDANNNEVTSTSHIGYINPIRYRGYYFDVETGLYYLQTRYYDPETGRFLNSDAIEYLAPEQLGGLNLYAYCNDNPVMDADPTGCFGILTAILIGAVIGAVIGATIEGVEAYEEAVEEGATGLELVGKTIAGAAKGAVIGGVVGAVAGATGYGAASAIVAGATALAAGTGAGGLALASGGAVISGEAIAGLEIVGIAAASASIVFFAKDPYVEKLKRGMTQNQKEHFQREIEDYKKSEGRGGKDNLPRMILEELAEYVIEMFK